MKKTVEIVLLVMVCFFASGATDFILAQPEINAVERELLEFVRIVNPQMAEKLPEIRQANPQEYKKTMEAVAEHYKNYRHLKAIRPKLAEKMISAAKLEAQAQALAEEYKKTDVSTERESLRTKVKSLLSEALDVKLTMEEARVEHLEQELQTLKTKISQRKQNRDKVIEAKLSELTKEDYIRW